MSVTFAPEAGPVDHYVATCLTCGTTQRFDDHDTVFALARSSYEGAARLDGCTDSGPYECGDATIASAMEAIGETPSANMANSNARDVLSTLGIPDEDLCGGMDPSDFLGRVLTGLALAPESAEIPTHAALGATNLITCGREAGYVQDRLRDLHEVAQFAIAHNRDVVWA